MAVFSTNKRKSDCLILNILISFADKFQLFGCYFLTVYIYLKKKLEHSIYTICLLEFVVIFQSA